MVLARVADPARRVHGRSTGCTSAPGAPRCSEPSCAANPKPATLSTSRPRDQHRARRRHRRRHRRARGDARAAAATASTSCSTKPARPSAGWRTATTTPRGSPSTPARTSSPTGSRPRPACSTSAATSSATARRSGSTAGAYDYPAGLLRVPRFVRSAITERTTAPASRRTITAADWFRHEYGAALADEIALPTRRGVVGRAGDRALARGGGQDPERHRRDRRARRSPPASPTAPSPSATAAKRRRARTSGTSTRSTASPRCARSWPATCSTRSGSSSPVERITVSEGRAVGVRVAGPAGPGRGGHQHRADQRPPRLVEGTDALDRFRDFRFRPMVFVNLRMRGRNLLPDTMTWTPQPQFPFFRLTETPQSMPWLAPEGKTLITADIGAEIGDEHWTMDDAELGELCIEALAEIVPERAPRLPRVSRRAPAARVPGVPHRVRSRPADARDHDRRRPAAEHRPQRRVRAHPHGGRLLADRPARPSARRRAQGRDRSSPA